MPSFGESESRDYVIVEDVAPGQVPTTLVIAGSEYGIVNEASAAEPNFVARKVGLQEAGNQVDGEVVMRSGERVSVSISIETVC